MIYENLNEDGFEVRFGYEMSQLPVHENDFCTFSNDCQNPAESVIQHDLTEVQINGSDYDIGDIEASGNFLPEEISGHIEETRRRVVKICSHCFVQFMMQSGEGGLY